MSVPGLYRKARKLLRDPRAFVRDSKGWRAAERALQTRPKIGTISQGALANSNLLVERAGLDLAQALDGHDRPVLAYLPWIDGHTGALIDALTRGENGFEVRPLPIFRDMNSRRERSLVTRYARQHPDRYRRALLRQLIPLRGRLAGFLFTFDWHPAMRITARVCAELGIRRILVPHEGVFMDAEKYYFDEASSVECPDVEHILCWGQMQYALFRDRGYPEERMTVTGAPKFDAHRAYRPTVDRATFFRVWGLAPGRKTILYAAQPLDNQADEDAAREAQQRVVESLLDYVEGCGCNLIVRMPPAGTAVLTSDLTTRIDRTPEAALDESSPYMFSPLEMLHHADCTVAINSTMLLETLLMDRVAIAARFFEYELFWEPLGLPVARDGLQLHRALDDALADGRRGLSESARHWVDNTLSAGATAGRASERVVGCLEELVARPPAFHDPVDTLLRGDPRGIGTAGFPHLESHAAQHRHVRELLGARRVRAVVSVQDAYASDVIVQWGAEPTPNKRRVRALAGRVGRPIVYVEDGFVRSIDIGLTGEPGLSLIVDDQGLYYDATGPSRLERMLAGDLALTDAQRARARGLIETIVARRVSKYNHAPDRPLSLGRPGRRKVAVLDQRKGDASVKYGLADEARFALMLERAASEHPDMDVLVKRHPDAIRGGKESYFADTQALRAFPNVVVVDSESNPYRFLALVDEVYTVTSGMGFEALMAGKVVHCFGMPFYAGWGLTRDHVTCPRRTRPRSLEEIFHVAYLHLSRYYHPDLRRTCELEELVDHIASRRDAGARSSVT